MRGGGWGRGESSRRLRAGPLPPAYHRTPAPPPHPAPPADSIEDKILALQERKRGVIAAAFGEDGAGGGGGFNARLTADDLRYLFS